MMRLIMSANYVNRSISAQRSSIVPDRLLIGGLYLYIYIIQRYRNSDVRAFQSVVVSAKFITN